MQNPIIKLFLHFDVLEYLNPRWLPDAILKDQRLSSYKSITMECCTSFMAFLVCRIQFLCYFCILYVPEYLNPR